jgi:DNA uptake protein ComE-like DNA-binding protein
MLEHLTFTGRELLLAVVLATLVYLLEVWLFPRRRKVAQQDDMASRLNTMQQEMDALKVRVDVLEMRPPAESALDTQKTLHAEAVRMARNGASAQELAEHLGISRTEADLIIALQKIKP